mmetsp:Transcript_11661/g.19904  ORF Transcript_11661/g.19904 Transcript_11661/m.19904 type:complete len:198 (-) Transcript_11661:67-660(-)
MAEEVQLKLLLIGNSGVGKSCVLVRFVDDEFDEDTPCTIGVDYKNTVFDDFHGKRVNLSIWDTAGQEKFRSLTSSYYRGTHGIVVVFDVNDRESFDNVDQWINEAQLYAVKCDPVMLLIGNKIDKPDRVVSKKEATEFARSKGMVYIETSAKTKVGIQQTFEELVQKILDKGNYVSENKPTVKPAYENQNQDDWGCC